MNDITQRLDALEAHVAAELAAIREQLAGMSGLPEVMTIPFQGHTWFTDGYRCIRDAWIGEFYPRPDQPDLQPLWESWRAITRPVVMVATVLQDGEHRLAVLSDGAFLMFDWMQELQATRGCTMSHTADPRQPVVFRDPEGEIVAAQAPVYDPAGLVLTDWRGLDGSPLEKPPACVKQ